MLFGKEPIHKGCANITYVEVAGWGGGKSGDDSHNKFIGFARLIQFSWGFIKEFNLACLG
jgi:hypothetical protein